MQAFGVFLLMIVAMFFIIPAYDYCINWWWKTLREQGRNIKPPRESMNAAIWGVKMATDKQQALERMAGETLAQNERIATLLNALTDVVSAWDSLKPGSYDKDIWETWLLLKMKPAIERSRPLACRK